MKYETLLSKSDEILTQVALMSREVASNNSQLTYVIFALVIGGGLLILLQIITSYRTVNSIQKLSSENVEAINDLAKEHSGTNKRQTEILELLAKGQVHDHSQLLDAVNRKD